MSILEREIAKIPFAVIDVESTGLSARHDRIVELAIVVVRPGGEEPQVVFDSLIRPDRPVAGTEIHGITDGDVADAPTFADVAPSIMAAFANRVVCSHNVYFDVPFVRAELERCGYAFEVPHVCSMLLPRVIDAAAPRLDLARACEYWRIERGGAHAALHDAMASAKILRVHLRELRKQALHTFHDLKHTATNEYEFLRSFARPLLAPPPVIHRSRVLCPRGGRPAKGRKENVAAYLDSLLDAVADLHLDDAEMRELQRLPTRLGLHDAEVRAVHAKIFWGMLGRFVEDARVDLAEAAHLRTLRTLLGRLGWAPGDDVGVSEGDFAESA